MIKTVFVALLLFLYACSNTSSGNSAGTGGGNQAKTAPAFTLDAYPSGQISLSDYSGKVVFLNFVGYSCPPCIASAPATQSEIADKYDPSVLQVLGLDVWDGSAGQVANFKTQTGVKYPVLMKASRVGTAYNAVNDYSVLVDKKGQIVYSEYGINITALREKIDQLIKE